MFDNRFDDDVGILAYKTGIDMYIAFVYVNDTVTNHVHQGDNL